MKTGILTFHNGINSGTFMQARGLCDEIASLGHDVSIIDYANQHQIRRDRESLWNTKNPRKLWHNYLKSRKYRKGLATLKLSRRIETPQEINELGYDAIVFGSDELWNLESSYANGDLAFLGEGIRGVRKIAYAPSFGSMNHPGGKRETVSHLLNDFSSLSARDDNTHSIIRDLTGHDVPLVVDPVLLSPKSEPRSNLKGRIGAYLMSPGPSEIKKVREFATKNNKRIVSVGYFHRWADEQLAALAPFEVPEALAGVDLVVTNTFHGVVFSLKHAKRFVLVDHPTKTTKLDTLCRLFDLKRVMSEDLDISPEQVNQISEDQQELQAMIVRSRRYLAEALGGS